ncbi:hypothetical protein BU25DRAFT_495861 [Macroventuria anomochaeta]|uniref:Uncharacterized protein n=1 Tax=Macroventuria anomochaeta TaxID=301207 RepID=A0ACB6RH83_9PLEO|nr:uncharacterized protein BU25DRAFT_495861 [Macroventuria anomochaeta]KAF2621306.1 hypothetical protein BU25DRAFT_495861 [Macroventuria anomochaeta]
MPTFERESFGEDIEDLQLHPAVPPALKQPIGGNCVRGRKPPSVAAITAPLNGPSDDSSDDTVLEAPDPAAVNIRNLVLSFQSKAKEGGLQNCGVLRRMHAVMEKFQGFREAIDECLEAVDECGLELDWAGEEEQAKM